VFLTDAASQPLPVNVALFAVAAAVVWFAGVRLTRNLDALAEHKGWDRAFVGMLMLGGITSLPEVANVATASSIGNPALAVNNLLGSASINVLLLAVADAAIGRRAVTGMVAHPSTMMMANLCMLVLIAFALAVTIGDVAVFGLGAGAVAISLLSIGCFRIATGYDRRAPWAVDDGGTGPPQESNDAPFDSQRAWLRVIFDGAVIFAAGYALSQTGDAIAEQTGIASALVGFALIGLATSTPELATVVTALRLKRPEMAFGQVLGTNFVNLSLLPLADLFYKGGPVINELGRFEVVSALLGASLVGVFLVGLLEHRDRTILKMGYDSAVVIVLFAAGLGFLATL
jgi:cation:H+ antiporter